MKLLFADDERSLQEVMRVELPRMGYEVTVCPDGTVAMAALARNTYDCILVDLDMPGCNGLEVVAKAKELSPDTEAIILTGKGSLDSAVKAMRHGTFDYLTKPCRLVELKAVLHRVGQRRELTNKYRAMKQRLERIEGTPDLIGESESMEQVRKLIAKVAPTDSTVLIRGDTGTGKELVARAVHDQSLRAEMPFVPINCGALPENLIESELFGHRKGAFTGADEKRIGLFEVADGGTLFLDEIGELPKAMQAKLLRFLESGEVRRVGDNESFNCDVRVVCATNRHLDQMVVDEQFREDLWFRINTFEIAMPPLRERTEDIELLGRHLAARLGFVAGPDDEIFTKETLAALSRHDWPGNVRELANVVEHAMILRDDGPIGLEHMPGRFIGQQRPIRAHKTTEPVTLRELEIQAIYDALDRHSGNKPKAAEELGISLKTLYNKLNQVTSLDKSA